MQLLERNILEILQQDCRVTAEEIAVMLGEEAGTKLLAPMFLMLAVVLVIVIVPAFMSVQI